uniref:Uncharacterized protein n=1 Tax=Arundo donax TaxID=35708 RepID=A0A0A9HPH9_ARUDO
MQPLTLVTGLWIWFKMIFILTIFFKEKIALQILYSF